jgi:hypothetical protein
MRREIVRIVSGDKGCTPEDTGKAVQPVPPPGGFYFSGRRKQETAWLN